MDFLVVDDDPVAALLAQRMLTVLGHRARIVEGGAAALGACAELPPQAVLMDLQMAPPDGLETTRLLRAAQAEGRLPRFPIMVVSGDYTPADRAAALAAGADGFIAKPLMLAKLGSAIYNVMQPSAAAAAR